MLPATYKPPGGMTMDWMTRHCRPPRCPACGAGALPERGPPLLAWVWLWRTSADQRQRLTHAVGAAHRACSTRTKRLARSTRGPSTGCKRCGATGAIAASSNSQYAWASWPRRRTIALTPSTTVHQRAESPPDRPSWQGASPHAPDQRFVWA
jgi:hypothetical protein